MKLRNKKTGKIEDVYTQNHDTGFYIGYDNGCYHNNTYYRTLSDFMDEWEDVSEEPKVYWYIMGKGKINSIEDDNSNFDIMHKLIGNYFDTREEAEQAVEKLKTWKRLKDIGFRFCGTDIDNRTITFEIPEDFDLDEEDDFYLLFGGEE